MNVSEKILRILKMEGEVSASHLADKLGVTKEGARLHLVRLAGEGLVDVETKSGGVGRPVSYYSLSQKGLSNFPNAHAQITVDLIQSIRSLLGENALDLLIRDREKRVYSQYDEAMKEAVTIEERLARLSDIRSEEGYMAEWKKVNDEYFLIENHCPICAAATECQQFCRAELSNFQQLMGDNFEVDRVQHIISGEPRCKYRIRSK